MLAANAWGSLNVTDFEIRRKSLIVNSADILPTEH